MRRAVAAAISLFVLIASCGREDVELLVYIGKLPDGGVSGASDAQIAVDGGADVCTPAQCSAAGATCSTRSECCSGACEPNVGGGRVCLAQCRADGESCTRALDCCGRACNAGRCGGVACKKRNDTCGSPSECCSNRCTNGECALDDTFTCRPSGEDCSSGSGSGCCGVCGQDGVCAPGPGPCAAGGVACQVDGDCCGGSCAPDAFGKRVCNGPPASGTNAPTCP